MKLKHLLEALWPLLLILFLSVSVAQLTSRLKAKAGGLVYDQPHNSMIQAGSGWPSPRANAMLGGACILLAAFWGFDALLTWWLYKPA